MTELSHALPAGRDVLPPITSGTYLRQFIEAKRSADKIGIHDRLKTDPQDTLHELDAAQVGLLWKAEYGDIPVPTRYDFEGKIQVQCSTTRETNNPQEWGWFRRKFARSPIHVDRTTVQINTNRRFSNQNTTEDVLLEGTPPKENTKDSPTLEQLRMIQVLTKQLVKDRETALKAKEELVRLQRESNQD